MSFGEEKSAFHELQSRECLLPGRFEDTRPRLMSGFVHHARHSSVLATTIVFRARLCPHFDLWYVFPRKNGLSDRIYTNQPSISRDKLNDVCRETPDAQIDFAKQMGAKLIINQCRLAQRVF